MRNIKKPFTVAFGLAILSCAVADARKPNIILFMTDDMGIECLSTYGAETYKTPVLDKLAAQGMKFNHCYSQPLCTPSRVKIMTGRYNFRNYTKFKHLDPSQMTFGHVAKSAGYTTAVCGKWQLDGEQDGSFAKNFGFDSHCLWYFNHKNYGSRYLHPKLVVDNKSIEVKGGYGPDIVNDFALKFIDTNKEKPFFLYYPMILPHFPFEATPDSKDWDPKVSKAKKDKKYYIDMVQYADKLVGKVVRKIDSLGLADDTLIMFTSDNGTMRGLHSTWRGMDFPGGKGRLDNTGCHVPFIVRWNKQVKPGSVSDHLVDFSDFFATVQEITGGAGPKDYTVDGRSMLGLFRGDDGYQARTYTYCHYDPKWGTPETGQFARNQSYKVYGGGSVYHVAEDYFEKSPLKKAPESGAKELEALRKVVEQMKSEGSRPEEKLSRGEAAGKKKKAKKKR
ncbi:sulfatase-like hydrolase/transferase [Verrucomicrobiaceae bacterium N1E253]|uniref:Sulfatase-like hydrolase/transferase n=1 Tax=Oceaniferula marina TaxID=2748318 RepID=A0A851GI27_9BACT|nr:sulfatase-like hydrolase/transferase [Oceaniferula marina]NWK54787.1 sulfatase-like hydrolase/transferase [Oceaniferula marina]